MKFGITSTIPLEVVLAGGHSVVDLNNLFIDHARPIDLVKHAERSGFPTKCCGWIRGIYGAVVSLGRIDGVIAVTGGDCSNTSALSETFEIRGIPIVPFAFPFERQADSLLPHLQAFAQRMGTDLDRAEEVRRTLIPLRRKLAALDVLLADGRLAFEEYHPVALSSSDLAEDWKGYETRVTALLDSASVRRPQQKGVPVGLIGVPPIISDFPEMLRRAGLRVVYDEVPRQFCMSPDATDLADQYTRYSYPFGMTGRLHDITANIRSRNISALIHYTQSFCFRAIEDVVLRHGVDVPVLTIEGDEPVKGDERLRLRLESFSEMLRSF
jgi:benzoyl-CoA reductase/2-hydroxyglutaryl-CoA dehydratase subunit BcrC/BadD/HgdB